MDRAEILERIWRQEEPTVFLSRRDFMASLDGWDIIPQMIDGELAGATITKGPEFHFISFGARKAVTRELAQACLQPILDKFGFVRTRTPREDTRQGRFNRLIGFDVEFSDEHYTYFRMARLRLHGRTACQS